MAPASIPHPPVDRRLIALAATWLLVCVALIYLPDIGRGFIKDDYGWIASSHAGSWTALRQLFIETPMGFYRPLVSLSFAINGYYSPLQPFPYAVTNLALVCAIAGGTARLARRLGLEPGAALFAAAVWMFNFHGINMSVLWISGRTSLLGTLGAVLAANAFASSRFLLAGLMVLVALFSKEEPLLLPLVFAGWMAVDARRIGAWASAPAERRSEAGGWGPVVRAWALALWPAVAAVAIYLAMRARTHALTPANAPDFYRFSTWAIAGNALQYLDRSLTFPAALLALGALGVSRARLALTPLERSIIFKGGIWLVCGFALTIMVPVRSSLYVCLPTVGSALMAAALGSAWWRATTHPRLTLTALTLLPLALLPVYRSRNARIRNEAILASNALTTIAQERARTHPEHIVIIDNRTERPSMSDAFGEDTLPLALRLMVPDAAGVEVIVRPGVVQPAPDAVTYTVHDAQLIQVR